MFLGKSAVKSELEVLSELDKQSPFAEEFMALAGIDACDPELEQCTVYGLVRLEDNTSAIVEMDSWDAMQAK